MVDVFPKWIIEGRSLIIGKVSFHRQLAENINNVKGGGWFVFDQERDAFILYGKSEDFGRCSKEIIHDAVSRRKVGRFVNDERYSNMKIFFSSSDKIDVALDDMVELAPYQIENQEEEMTKIEAESVDEKLMNLVGYNSYIPVTSSKIGRNEPCPCRSGKKFKKCCWK